MYIVCSDLEGVFVPEVWINVSKRTGIDELKLTTRDISDYNVLMKGRLDILRKHSLTLHDIQSVISLIDPLPGACEFLNWLRSQTQVIIVSDTFVEFADPLIEKLGRPTLFCHHLTVDNKGTIVNYNLRQADAKRKVAEALQSLNYKVIAIGDSYNDISMLKQSELGILFKPPQNVIDDNPDFIVVHSYTDLKKLLIPFLGSE
jgi:phosphoserine / homoserine phosphotransferase